MGGWNPGQLQLLNPSNRAFRRTSGYRIGYLVPQCCVRKGYRSLEYRLARVSETLKSLMDSLPQVGSIEWIGLRPARRTPMNTVSEVECISGRGLVGDRAGARPGGKRQVSLIQAEHLPVIAALLELEEVRPEWLRRNLLVSGINLRALKGRRFRVGGLLFEGTGDCDPCQYMEEVLGAGGFNAMRGHGGLTARVLESGRFGLGASVALDRDPG